MFPLSRQKLSNLYVDERALALLILVIDGRYRNNIQPGMEVDIILKKDQHTGKTTKGIVKDLLTKSSFHPHGIKVRLEDRQVGRVHTKESD